MVQDITQRKQAEEELRASEQRLRLILAAVPEGITTTDLEGNITQVNDAVVALHGYSRKEEILGRNALEFIAARDRARAMENLRKTREKGRSGVVEYTFLKKDGKEFDAELSAAVLMDEEGKPAGFIAAILDISERKRMQQQLMQTDRLAAIGMLVSGVAHEVNNPLTGALGYVELLLRRDLDEAIRSDLEVVRGETQRAARIMRNLLSFAREHKPEKTSVSVNEVVESTLDLRAYEMRVSNVEVKRDLQPDLPSTMADKSQLQQVFLNIVLNAEQAMIEAHGRGTLVAETRHVGDAIHVTIADDGPGIPEGNLARIFDPFFTTKEVGKGTGLGLSICYGIVQEHGGNIYVSSEVGKGATFTVELPIVAEAL